MKKPYEPIACALHDEYEIAIMRKKPLRIGWTDEAGCTFKCNVLPVDLLVSDGEEFLVVVEDSAALKQAEKITHKIRLDRVTLYSSAHDE